LTQRNHEQNVRKLINVFKKAIVSIPLSCTVFEIFDVEEYRGLKIKDRGHSPCKFMYKL